MIALQAYTLAFCSRRRYEFVASPMKLLRLILKTEFEVCYLTSPCGRIPLLVTFQLVKQQNGHLILDIVHIHRTVTDTVHPIQSTYRINLVFLTT